jgi:chemotaxis protein histidine kinase CheA
MSDGSENHSLDDDIMARMQEEFQKEARDHLDQLNLLLIQLEVDPDDDKLINRVFRVAHTIKGSAGFAGLTAISDIGRKMEDLIGNVRKELVPAPMSVIEVMFECIDVLSDLLDAAQSGNEHTVSVEQFMAKLDDSINDDGAAEPEKEEEVSIDDLPEIAVFYKAAYDQLATLKHLVYSSTHLTDEESLAVLFSKQIYERMTPENNSFWLVKKGKCVAEVARNGKLIPPPERRQIDIESSEVLKRVINDLLTVWPNSLTSVKDIFPDYDSPTLFPLKSENRAYGFLGVDPEESTEVDAFQFVSHFAAMMLNISKLHQQVEQQKQDLDEMTQILFKQNSQLSSLYHVELELMGATELEELCAILVTSLVRDLEVARSAVFLIDQDKEQMTFAAESGLPGVHELTLPLQGDGPLQQSLQRGRIVSSSGYEGEFEFGGHVFKEWMVVGLKGREEIQAMLVAEFEDGDLRDSISILTNYSGILLENLRLQLNCKQTG